MPRASSTSTTTVINPSLPPNLHSRDFSNNSLTVSSSSSLPLFSPTHRLRHHRSTSSISSLPSEHLSKSGEILSTVGFGDNTVPLSYLQSLYLPHEQKDREYTHQNGENVITYLANHEYFPVRSLTLNEKKRILVTGGAGFVGSHLVDRLMLLGHDVICLDNFYTGAKSNVAHWIGHPNFELVRHDVVEPFKSEVDQIYHLACPASPPNYQYNPVKTVKTAFMGTYNMLGLAKRVKARFLLASTSEVYGDPIIHPQTEEYWGNVNCIGPRACYDEGKRVAETITYGYQRQDNVEVRVARIFNTFGPRMNPNDGRVVSNFLIQALRNEKLTIYGDGSATRSFQYIHDLIDGLILLMNSEYSQPVNIGNPEEVTVKDFAKTIINTINKTYDNVEDKLSYMIAPRDDPKQRRPDVTVAARVLNWQPRWTVQKGLEETCEYFKSVLEQGLI